MTAISMDVLLRLAKQNGDLIREQNTAIDTATVMARLIDEADVVYAVWATNPTDPGPSHALGDDDLEGASQIGLAGRRRPSSTLRLSPNCRFF